MERYRIRGGNRLHGEVEISGAKNAAVAIIPAALMVNGKCRIENLPQISDTEALLLILESLGARTARTQMGNRLALLSYPSRLSLLEDDGRRQYILRRMAYSHRQGSENV